MKLSYPHPLSFISWMVRLVHLKWFFSNTGKTQNQKVILFNTFFSFFLKSIPNIFRLVYSLFFNVHNMSLQITVADLKMSNTQKDEFHELYLYFIFCLLELHLCNYNTVFIADRPLMLNFWSKLQNKCSPKISCVAENLDFRARVGFFGVDPLFPGRSLVPLLEQREGVFGLPGLWLKRWEEKIAMIDFRKVRVEFYTSKKY